jgi:protein-tyrosine phosphatase
MDTQVIRMDASRVDHAALERAGELLRAGGLVAFPTETVYGVAARADQPTAMARLREVKQRSAEKAFTVHIASREEAADFVPTLSGMAARLARKGWPGPLTLIIPVPDPSGAPVMQGRNGSVADAIYYDNSVGLRCPDDRVALEILRLAGGPVVAASANKGGEPPSRSGTEAVAALGGSIDLVVDTGETKYARPSTIVRVDGDRVELLREGVYDRGIIERLATVRLLFVCTGNTCRSPMAAGLAAKLLAERLGCSPADLPDHRVIVESAGTSGGIGTAAAHAVEVLGRRGVDLTEHFSRAVSADMIHQADYVYVMTRAHREAMLRLSPGASDRVSLLLRDDDLPDPLGGAEADYENCAARIETALRERLQEVIL